MPCNTDLLCAAAGLGAVVIIMNASKKHLSAPLYAPTECSARVAKVATDNSPNKPATWDKGMFGGPNKNEEDAEKDSRNPVDSYIEQGRSKGIGHSILLPGICKEDGKPPKMDRACADVMLYQTDAFAQRHYS